MELPSPCHPSTARRVLAPVLEQLQGAVGRRSRGLRQAFLSPPRDCPALPLRRHGLPVQAPLRLTSDCRHVLRRHVDGKKKRGGEAFKRRMLQKMYLVVLQRCDPFTERGWGERGGEAKTRELTSAAGVPNCHVRWPMVLLLAERDCSERRHRHDPLLSGVIGGGA